MKLVIVGGFLGAGKTTLLQATAQRLAARGHLVGLITNDQVPDLVDTALLSADNTLVREVAGSCFCCNFKGFEQALASLEEAGASAIVAEPVGSCTDLSATILQPFKDRYPHYDLTPLSVLIDPQRVREVFHAAQPLLHPDAAYILRLQLEEADRILLSKGDTLTPAEREELLTYLRAEFPGIPLRVVSAESGEGIEAWIEDVLAGADAGARVIDVDYDRYANGEAVLGWLNARIGLRWTADLQANWPDYLRTLLTALQAELEPEHGEIGHVKGLLETAQGRIIGNITGSNVPPIVRFVGVVNALHARLTLNARAQIEPAGLDAALRRALETASHARVAPTVQAFHCIKPGRPEPTHRYAAVVK